MEENTNIKQILIYAGIALGFMAILVGVILTLNTFKSGSDKTAQSSDQNSDDDMASHHAPPPPADDTLFKSLLSQKAPDFSLEDYSGEKFTLSDSRGKNVVLFFSEGAMCYPGCWNQVDAFVDDAKKFANKNTSVYTVVVDSKTDWKGALDKDPKMGFANVLLDVGGKVSSSYGVLTVTSSMHRGQFPGHTYVAIDKEGVIRFLLDDGEMGIQNQRLLTEVGKL